MNVGLIANAPNDIKQDVQSPASKVELACKRVKLIDEDKNGLQRR